MLTTPSAIDRLRTKAASSNTSLSSLATRRIGHWSYTLGLKRVHSLILPPASSPKLPTKQITNRPSFLPEINCTIPFISDPLFHLLEFYIHNDAPLTCRIPTIPLTSAPSLDPTKTAYTPLVFALSGTLQLSHLHISPDLNILLHSHPPAAPDTITAAIAYSLPTNPDVPAADQQHKLVIGDPLPFRLSVRWYPGTSLPGKEAWTGYGGHVYASTIVYCLLGIGAGVAGTWAWWRGVELPRRLRGYKGDREKGANGFGTYGGGYAFVGSGGYGGVAPGKRD